MEVLWISAWPANRRSRPLLPRGQRRSHCRFQTAPLRQRICRCRQSALRGGAPGKPSRRSRSEEHTSELQSRPHLVCRLLLEKKKKKILEKCRLTLTIYT